MPRNDYAIDIDCPASGIFPMLSGANLTRWIQGLVNVEQIGDLRIGTKIRHVYENRGIDHIELNGEITACEPNHYLAFTNVAEQNGAGFTTMAEYHLHESNGTTRVEYRSESIYRGFFVRLMSPIVTLMGQRQIRRDMQKLKVLMENGA